MISVAPGMSPAAVLERELRTDDAGENRRYWCEWAWTGEPASPVAPGVLDTCCLAGGIGTDGRHRPPESRQARFSDGDADAWAARVDAFHPRATHARAGAGVHRRRRAGPAPR